MFERLSIAGLRVRKWRTYRAAALVSGIPVLQELLPIPIETIMYEYSVHKITTLTRCGDVVAANTQNQATGLRLTQKRVLNAK